MSAQRFFSIGIGAVASLALAGFFGTQALEIGSGSKSHTDHLAYSSAVEHVDVSTGNGEIALVHSSGAKTSVARTVTESLRSAPVRAQVNGSTLELSGGCGSYIIGSCSVSYVIQVPEGVSVTANSRNGGVSASGVGGRTELSTGSGGIDASDIRGDLTAETSSGSIDVTDVDGRDVVLHTGSGSIDADGLDAEQVSAETGSGGIDVGLTSVPESVTAHTGSGSATVRVPHGPAYDVRTHTGSGQNDVLVTQDSTSSHHIEVETGSGAVEVRYGH